MGNAHAVRASAHGCPQVDDDVVNVVADSNATRPDTNHGYGLYGLAWRFDTRSERICSLVLWADRSMSSRGRRTA